MQRPRLGFLFLLLSASAASSAERRPPPCQGPAHYRKLPTQGTLLWGTARKVESDERSSMLTSIELDHVQLQGGTLTDVQVQGGHIVAPSLGPSGLKGALLKGRAGDGQPVEVAVCDESQATDDTATVGYRAEVWNAESEMWESPCVATNKIPKPRVLVVPGVWDATGARHDLPGKATLACESGVIAKCVQWGYKPWEQREGRSLSDLHQACTRMARADYCGNGISHTREETRIDIYDALRINTRTTESSAEWDLLKARFEAAWGPEGAACLAQTRDGRPVETIQAECPGRFEAGMRDLGGGDVCRVLRKGGDWAAALLRNHSYGKQ